MHRLLAAATLMAVLPLASAASSEPLRWPATHEPHRAIFCAFYGHTEATQGYSEALVAELRRLEGAGLTGTAIWVRLGLQARCHRGPAADDGKGAR